MVQRVTGEWQVLGVPVAVAHTIMYPWAMVVKVINASVAHAAVLTAQRLERSTRVTQPGEGVEIGRAHV